jgi:hypothetical protein
MIVLELILTILHATLMAVPEQDDFERRKSMASSIASPEGTPLLMRIKKARELEKWDSVNSFTSTEALQDGPAVDTKTKAERLYHRVRKTSAHSLGGTATGLGPQQKRMSVPSMAPGGDSGPNVQQFQQGQVASLQMPMPPRGKSFVGLPLPDLKELAEEDHSEETSRENSQPPEQEKRKINLILWI